MVIIHLRALLFPLLLIITSSRWLAAQQNPIDSLQKELNNTERNQEKVLAHIYKKSRSNDSLNTAYIDLGLRFSTENGLLEWQVGFLLTQAKWFLKAGEIVKSTTNCFEAIQIIHEYSIAQELEGRAHFLLAHGLKELGAYEEAIHHRKEQLAWATKNNYTEKIPKIQGQIAALYIAFNQCEPSLYYYEKEFAKIGANKEEYSASDLNNLGLAYTVCEKSNLAQKYFTQAYDRLKGSNLRSDSILFSVVCGNLANSLQKDGNEIIIDKLIDEKILYARKFNIPYVISSAYLARAELNIHSKKYALAKIYLDSALTLNYHTNLGIYHKRKFRLSILQNLILVHEKLNDYKNALNSAKDHQLLSDSIFEDENAKEVKNSLIRHQISGIKKELEIKKLKLNESNSKITVLKKEEELSRVVTTLILVIGSSLFILTLIIIYKMKGDAKKKREINNLKNQMYEASIKNQTNRLTEAAISLARKKEFSKNLIEELYGIEGLDRTNLIPLKQFVSNEMNMDESILETEKYIAELSREFFLKLELQFPHLTRNDLKMCGLVRLNLSIKELAIIKHITPESVKLAKNRLSKKLNLKPGSSLFEFLKQY